jgi:hypothetical protein
MTTKYASNIPNGRKIYQMSTKYTNIFHSTDLQNLPKFVFWVGKFTIWQPRLEPYLKPGQETITLSEGVSPSDFRSNFCWKMVNKFPKLTYTNIHSQSGKIHRAYWSSLTEHVTLRPFCDHNFSAIFANFR